MTKAKLKSTIFNSDIVYKQNYVPLIFIAYFIVIREMPESFWSNYTFEFILFIIPINIIWIYPVISLIWCAVNYIYKKRKNTINKTDTKSLVRSICIFAVDSYFMFTLYMMANLGI